MNNESNPTNRREFLGNAGKLAGWAALSQAMAAIPGYAQSIPGQSVRMPKGFGNNKHVVILGGGVGGLAAAYELLGQGSNLRCTVLEASNKVGGRTLTVRPNPRDRVIHEEGYEPQVCAFQNEANQPYQPYLNAGAGRIPSGHKHLLGYLKRFRVPLEVYVMDSRSNLTHANGKTYVNRQLANDTRGWLAQYLYESADGMENLNRLEQQQLKSLLEKFGALSDDEATLGKYLGSSRAGYSKLPGVHAGEVVSPMSINELLASEFWASKPSRAPFYQPKDFLWQPTSFQPVGGMDHVPMGFASQVEMLGGNIELNAFVQNISYDSNAEKYLIRYNQNGRIRTVIADYCISNIPIPLLRGKIDPGIFDPYFRDSLVKVMETQNFLQPTTKVGWQARRNLWQQADAEGQVPIFGGVSWTSHDITQIWYPSDEYHAELGVLTGAYNFGAIATKWGQTPPKERIEMARKGARSLASNAFADGLGHGLAIAWQNMPYQKGGWMQWRNVSGNCVDCFNNIIKGNKNFFVVGDQASSLMGWQEGALLSAIHVANSIVDKTYEAPVVKELPDTRETVEGIY